MKKQKVRFEKFRPTNKCPECGEKVSKWDEGHHLAYECKKRLVSCRFCAVVLPGEIASEHEEYCGAKTAVCKNCGRYVVIRDFFYHQKSCEEANPALPCELCERLVSANELASHQRKCLDEKVDKNYILKGDIGETFRPSAIKTKEKESRENRSKKQGREKMKEVKQECDEASARKDRTGKKWPKSHRESITIVALPCEICGELCPSNKLMDHQIECQQERENVHQNNPKTVQQTSPREHECNFSGHDFPQKTGTTYIEVQTGYSPTIEFTDDDESLEGDIGLDFFARDERNPNDFSHETFTTRGDAGACGVRYIEYQRSYSPVMEFEEETVSEIFAHDIPTFRHARDPSCLFECSNPPRFNQVESRFGHGKN